MDDHESLLDALARLCGAFSAVVRGNAPAYHGDPTECPAYREALAILGRDLEKAHPAAADAVRAFQRAAGDVGPKPRVVVGETVGAKTAEALRAHFRDADTNPATAYELGRSDGQFVERGALDAALASLRNLHLLVVTDTKVRQHWADDPAKCLRMAIVALEARHIHSEQSETLVARARASGQACTKCFRQRPTTVADPACPQGGYCDWSPK